MTVRAGLGSRPAAPASRPVLTVEAETDEGSHRGSEALGLLDRQVTPLHRSEVAVLVLLDDQGVDEPDDVALAESAAAPSTISPVKCGSSKLTTSS